MKNESNVKNVSLKFIYFEGQLQQLVSEKVARATLRLLREKTDAQLLHFDASAFHTVVVSAHTERAMEAFELGVLDFIGKPFSVERIQKTVDRLRGTRASNPAKTLAVRSAGRIDLVPISEIAYIRAAGSYTELVLRNGAIRVHSKSLDRLLSILPTTFERVHRSYLIRLDEVVQIRVKEGSRYSAVLSSGEEIPVGRTRVSMIRQRLGIA